MIGQANNVFIFPGIGLGALVAEARELTDDAFLTAAEELAASVSTDRLAAGGIFPPIGELRPIARRIAVAVVRRLRDTGYGRQFRDEDIEPAVDARCGSRPTSPMSGLDLRKDPPPDDDHRRRDDQAGLYGRARDIR